MSHDPDTMYANIHPQRKASICATCPVQAWLDCGEQAVTEIHAAKDAGSFRTLFGYRVGRTMVRLQKETVFATRILNQIAGMF